jgi:hypothetical protein
MDKKLRLEQFKNQNVSEVYSILLKEGYDPSIVVFDCRGNNPVPSENQNKIKLYTKENDDLTIEYCI